MQMKKTLLPEEEFSAQIECDPAKNFFFFDIRINEKGELILHSGRPLSLHLSASNSLIVKMEDPQ